jgi:hypothetical protein
MTNFDKAFYDKTMSSINWELLASAYNIDVSGYISKDLIRDEVMERIFGYEPEVYLLCA